MATRKQRENKAEQDQKPRRSVASVVDPDGFMAETIILEGYSQLHFVTLEGGLSEIIERPDVDLIPPFDPNGLVRKGVVLLPGLPRTSVSQERIVADLREFIHRYADVPQFWEVLIAHYVLMTWVYDRFTAVPYLRFLGEPQTGKTRCLQVAGHLAYKAIMAGGATTSSPIFRLMDVYRGTLVIDEADYKSSDLWSEIIKILNSGYMQGMPILRSEPSDDGYEPRAFDLFGPKILSTRKAFEDYALETRCITLNTQEGRIRSDVPRQLPKRFYDEAQELRSELLAWRFANYDRIQSDETDLLSLEPRLTQIGAPLYSVSLDTAFKSMLVAFLGQHAEEQRAERPQSVIVEAIRMALGAQDQANIAIKDVAMRASETGCTWGIDGGFSPKRVGHLVRSLGFHPARTRDGYQFRVTQNELAELMRRYQKSDGRNDLPAPRLVNM